MIEGILNIDKPVQMTSHDIVQDVRRLAHTRRVGHAGTLDPLASGVLIIGVERATRLLEYVVAQPKTYEAVVRFGEVSTTYDGEGVIEAVNTEPVRLGPEELSALLRRFCGEIQQLPPMYSAVKHHGQPLYKLARQGVHVERKARSVRIYSLELLRWEPPVATLQVTCSAGTYVRTLAHDLGEASGYGAYLAGLRRTAVGGFKIASAVTLAQLRREGVKAHLQSLDRAVAHLPRLAWPSEAATRLAQGQTLPRRDGDPTNGSARAYDDAGEFVGIVETDEGNWRPRKIFYQPS